MSYWVLYIWILTRLTSYLVDACKACNNTLMTLKDIWISVSFYWTAY